MFNAAAPARLVAMGDEHLSATLRWLVQSGELRKQVDCLHPPTEAGNAAYWRSRWEMDNRRDFAIILGDGRHVGNCGLCDIDGARGKAQLWIYLGDSHGRGYGVAAVDRLLSFAFLELGLNRIYLRVVASNPRARDFYLRRGFVEEGVFRQDTRQEEKFVDSIAMSMLASEYRPGVSGHAGGI
ncbi:MAG: GNAT family N-acetyltransferase [Rhodocyclaceae bacterium]|nr:GNAT family N-acetyltransferase [Rhodocyclaceae bacterium]